ncbi:MAG: hypothetical protein HC849_18350 [Oscillatoriales cyanobacterium RU_3_3]|nr:hypothetical protein [Oscillatoriales cyanobacterium RU_3_3]NJR25046.1 hypothetical protein [Richelia sp. CSU_2_1]
MKVTIRDSNILKTIDFNEVAQHLQKKGWHETGKIYNDLGSIWRFKDCYSGEEFEILLPLKYDLGDYAARISDAIKTLEEVEKRSQLDILSDLLTVASNITIQGMVIQVPDRPIVNNVTVLGVVVTKLRKIQMELTEFDCNTAIKAYRDRLPILCSGDLIKIDDTFVLQNPRGLILGCGN